MSKCVICGDEFTPTGKQKRRCFKTHTRECQKCGEDFILKSTDKETRIFCSRKCSLTSRTKERHCENCGITMSQKDRRTCSLQCRNELRLKTMSEKTYTSQCKSCGKEFTSHNYSILYCSRQHFSQCEVCKKNFEIDPRIGAPKACSNECRGKLINSEEANKKRTETYIKKYGVDHPFKNEEVKAKIRKSMVERHGGNSTFTSPELMKKVLETTIEKYGTPFPRQRNEEIKQRAEQTNLERYGSINPFGGISVKNKIRNTMKEKYENGVIPHSRISSINKRYAEFFKDNGFTDIKYEQPFGKFYSDLKIGDTYIDIHPTVTHNTVIPFSCVISGCEESCVKHKPISKNYHLERAMEAKKNNISLIQIYEWDDDDIVLKLISGKEREIEHKYSARKLEVSKISQRDANVFLKENHIQGSTKGQTNCYALLNEDKEIIAVATFGKSRFNKSNEYEFIRYAVKKDVLIHGGSGKLFKEFLKDANPESVISYVNFDHTTKQTTFLNSIGFNEERPTGPSIIWFNSKDKKAVKNTSLLSIGADRILGTNYGRKEICGLDNTQIMLKEGFLPVSTAGNRVFTWKR